MHWPRAEREPFLSGLAGWLAPGGYLVLIGHDRTNIADGHGGPQDPDVLTEPPELKELFEGAGLEVLDAKIILRPVSETGHGGDDDTGEQKTARDHLVIARAPS